MSAKMNLGASQDLASSRCAANLDLKNRVCRTSDKSRTASCANCRRRVDDQRMMNKESLWLIQSPQMTQPHGHSRAFKLFKVNHHPIRHRFSMNSDVALECSVIVNYKIVDDALKPSRLQLNRSCLSKRAVSTELWKTEMHRYNVIRTIIF